MSSAAADPTAVFFAHIRASGLLKQAQLQELWAWISAAKPDVQNLAKEISRRGWMSAFQIKEIFRGNGRSLRLDRFVLTDVLGEGGMGRVYRAVDTRLHRTVAIKIIRKDKLKHPAAAARFHQEVQALAKMARHPNVVEVYDAELSGDTHYYAMELIDGTDLTKIVRDRGPLPVPEACEYIRQAALGLQHAHEAGLVHRDIKPSNVIVSRNGRQVKLVDLGLARLIENEFAAGGGEGHRLTQDGFVIGTPDFLAPEQARNPTAVDIRADVYALGGTLYFLLTGKVPYEGATPGEKLLKHCIDPPPRLLTQRPDAPPQVEQIIHWCMAKSPDARPQTPLQLALALQPLCPVAPAAAAPAQPAAAPAHAHAAAAPPPDPQRSSVVFRLPPQTTTDDPIRRRAQGGFPWGTVLMGLGALFVVGLLGFAIWRAFLGDGGEQPVESFTNSRGLRMVKLDGGTFRMGSPDDEPGRKKDEGPPHDVTITGPLLISATEVSHAQFLQVMGSSPSKAATQAYKAQNLPVENVTWEQAVTFCQKLTEAGKNQPWARKGWAYRLPTEAEWEYAARAGTAGPFAIDRGGQIVWGRQALYRPDPNDPLGVGEDDTGRPPPFPGEVGKTEPNASGLYDFHGNVAEWCLDWYATGYPEGPRVDPTGPADGDRRVVRGGSFRSPASDIRSAARASLRPTASRDDVGFRIVYAPIPK
ncbi:MAG TPA: bifunctional serine/threonine-protein kinase/formylglycine-generating enzyme family protein [Gemmata sp.]|nr:bifunctional serine/threonine-protein kinase/formylglycine-generating enzyme family protein [Gemmata sp.]